MAVHAVPMVLNEGLGHRPRAPYGTQLCAAWRISFQLVTVDSPPVPDGRPGRSSSLEGLHDPCA